MNEIANWYQRYIEQMKMRWAGNTLEKAHLEARRFIEFVGDRPLTPLIVADYQAAQHARSKSQWTIKSALEWAQKFLAWAEDMELIEKNRFARIIKIPSRPITRPQMFTHVQYEALKDESEGTMWHYAIIMAYRIGTRYSDTAMMKWEYVNLDKCYIQYVPWKSRRTGREAFCPFERGGDLHKVLLELSVLRNPHPMWAQYVCPEMAMNYPQHGLNHAPTARRSEFKRLCIKVGAEGLSFHRLRNSFISRLINAGGTFSIGGQLTGLGSSSVFNQYAVPDLDALRKAVDNMSKEDEPPTEGTIIRFPGAA